MEYIIPVSLDFYAEISKGTLAEEGRAAMTTYPGTATNTYPGDLANPEDVARWMAEVAKDEYGLPGILPVMTSCVELTAAWTVQYLLRPSRL